MLLFDRFWIPAIVVSAPLLFAQTPAGTEPKGLAQAENHDAKASKAAKFKARQKGGDPDSPKGHAKSTKGGADEGKGKAPTPGGTKSKGGSDNGKAKEPSKSKAREKSKDADDGPDSDAKAKCPPGQILIRKRGGGCA